MFLEHYGLNGQPFRLGPDPRFYFDSRGHRKALAYLTYGLEQGEGFIIVTGEVGAGKTTLIEYLLTLLDGRRYVAAQVVTTQTGADDTLRMVAAAFGLESEDATKASLLTRLRGHFHKIHDSGRRALLIVDEVQNLSLPSIEELRMLSNFHVERRPLLQIVMVGQPQFRSVLAGADLEQLRQRVAASYHLGPLSRDETEGYVLHRLRIVGWTGKPSLTPQAFDSIHSHTAGVPRRINTLCSRLLLFGDLEQLERLDGAAVTQVAEEWRRELMADAPPAVSTSVPALAREIAALMERLQRLEQQDPPPLPRPPARSFLARSFLARHWRRLWQGTQP